MSAATSASEQRALETLDAFMEALNAHAWARQATTINYPHVRFAGDRVTIWHTAEEFAAAMPQRIGSVFEQRWDHSGRDDRRVVHSSDTKVHLAVRFSRYDARGQPLASYESLYIVTLLDGHWGIQARSSFAR